jgi:hypothetical protein
MATGSRRGNERFANSSLVITVLPSLARNFHFSLLAKEKRVNFVQFHVLTGQNDQFLSLLSLSALAERLFKK